MARLRLWLLLFPTLIIFIAACSSSPLSVLESAAAAPTQTPQAAMLTEYAPTLTVDPPRGQGGVYIRVAGTGWPPNMMVIVRLKDAQGTSDTLAATNTDSTGSLSTGFLYPIDQRWLATADYQVTAATADGKTVRDAALVVGDPDANAIAAQPVTPTPEPAPELTPEPSTPVPTPTDIAVVTEGETTNKGVGQNETVALSQSAHIIADFVPVEIERDRALYRIQARPSVEYQGSYRTIAVIQTPQLTDIRDRQLKEHKKDVVVKFTPNKVEIKATDPAALLDYMQTHGGFPVQDGQLIEVKIRPASVVKIELDDDVLKIEAPQVVLQVTIVGPDGQTHRVVVPLHPEDLQAPPPNRGRGASAQAPGPPAWAAHDDDDDDDDDDD